MAPQSRIMRARVAACGRGQAMILTVVLIAIGMGAALLVMTSTVSVSIANKQAKYNEAVLVQAKDALIGRSASDGSRPGSLPCPDTDDNGVAEIFVGSNCPSYIGRLPWRTLGLPDPRDASEERLWYMLSTRFRDNSAAEPINSDTKGDVTVYVGNGSTVLTNEAVAVIFAPGAAIENQIRDAANKNNALNYLESTSGINNASATGPYISAQPTATFNDRLLVLTTAELMPPVEMRVAREVRTLLENYKSATACHSKCTGSSGCYPWADVSDGNSDAPPYQVAGVGLNRGRVPAIGASPFNWGASVCAGPPVPTVPAWFLNNNWRWVIYYSAGKAYLESGGSGCSSCVGFMLTVDGVMNRAVVILMPGPANASRPPAVPGDDPTFWQFYFEDPQNNDHKTDTTGNDLYDTPSSTAYTRDRIFTIP